LALGVVLTSRLGFDPIKESMKYRTLIASLLVAFGAAHAFAQTTSTGTPTTTASTVQRDVNQQTRIQAGLQNGSLSTREAGRLEKEESQVERLQAQDLKDGKLTPRERIQLRRAQDKASRDIHNAKTNEVTGNPESKSSERMQADVARNVNQEKRVEQGVRAGTLSNREVGKLEQGQSRVDRKEAHAARDGHIGKMEQAGMGRQEDKQSEDIFQKKHNARERKG
jgi:hypothetical protein